MTKQELNLMWNYKVYFKSKGRSESDRAMEVLRRLKLKQNHELAAEAIKIWMDDATIHCNWKLRTYIQAYIADHKNEK